MYHYNQSKVYRYKVFCRNHSATITARSQRQAIAIFRERFRAFLYSDDRITAVPLNR